MTQHPNSEALWLRAHKVLAGGPATLSKDPARYPLGLAPKFLMGGEGPYVTDMDGHRYLDTVAALGPVLLGHNYPAVRDAVRQQAGRLASSTLSTALEVEVAEMLCDLIPGAEMCRFATNGADVCNAAVKLARYVTGKQHMLYCGYHGGHDSYLITTDKHGGILAQISPYNHQLAWNDLDAFAATLALVEHDLAGMMVEVPPEPTDRTTEDTRRTLELYRDYVHKAGGIFVLDEVVTGWRYGLGGAQAYYSVQADLCTFSKAMGNGFPVAAVLGQRDMMQAFTGGAVFLSTTFGASPLGLAACKATLNTLLDTDAWTQLHDYGLEAHTYVSILLAEHQMPATVRGNFARFVIDWQAHEAIPAAALRTLWLQELLKGGVLANIPWFPMATYTDAVVTHLTDAVRQACEVIGEVIAGRVPLTQALQSPVITDVFERYRPQGDWPT